LSGLVPPFGFAAAAELERIIDQKYEPGRTRLRALFNFVVARLAGYENSLPSPVAFAPYAFVHGNKRDLAGCYAPDRKPVHSLLSRIKNLQPQSIRRECLYCGIDKSDTWDHYLPQEMFPELSVHPLNLVPCCSTCNSHKRTRYLLITGGAAFINLYFDILPDVEFLRANVTTLSDSVVVTFSIDPGIIPVRLEATVASHFAKLKLFPRYAQEASGIAARLKDELKPYDLSPAELRSELHIKADAFIRSFGRGHWRVCLHRKLAESDAFYWWLNS
jgi:5-methylcytosine-specific restriction endonuclease McrA